MKARPACIPAACREGVSSSPIIPHRVPVLIQPQSRWSLQLVPGVAEVIKEVVGVVEHAVGERVAVHELLEPSCRSDLDLTYFPRTTATALRRGTFAGVVAAFTAA
jgi:hypothetical protein